MAARSSGAAKKAPVARKKASPAKKAGKRTAKAPAKAPAKASASRPRWVPRFGARGGRMWAAHREQVDGERGLVMLEEACRMADRLDKLDGLLKGDVDVWCRLIPDPLIEGVYELRISGALIEARQQANVLRQIVASLPLKEGGDDDDPDRWLDDL